MKENQNKGIIQLLIIIVLSVIILSLLGVSLRALFTDQTLKENFVFLWNFLKHAGRTYLWPYLQILWQKVQELR